MNADRLRMVPDVAVHGVRVSGADVHVGLYGGPTNACASVRYTFDVPAIRDANIARLREWEAAGTALMLVVGDGVVTLTSAQHLLDHATSISEH